MDSQEVISTRKWSFAGFVNDISFGHRNKKVEDIHHFNPILGWCSKPPQKNVMQACEKKAGWTIDPKTTSRHVVDICWIWSINSIRE